MFMKMMISTVLCMTLAIICVTAEECANDLSGSKMVTRLWKGTDSGTTIPKSVVNQFLEGFAPDVTCRTGFKEYVGQVVDSDHSFFLNVFETAAQASGAQTAAANFVDTGNLMGEIERKRFFEGDVSFHKYASCDTATGKAAGNYLTGMAMETHGLTPDETLAFSKTGIGAAIESLDGFVTFVGVKVTSNTDDNTTVFIYHVFDTVVHADAADTAVQAYIASNAAFDAATTVLQQWRAEVTFDLNVCTPKPDDSTTMPPSTTPSTGTSFHRYGCLAVVALICGLML